MFPQIFVKFKEAFLRLFWYKVIIVRKVRDRLDLKYKECHNVLKFFQRPLNLTSATKCSKINKQQLLNKLYIGLLHMLPHSRSRDNLSLKSDNRDLESILPNFHFSVFRISLISLCVCNI